LERYLQIGDIRTRYLDRGTGQAAILVHGLGGSIESWANNIEGLSREIRAIALDLPGFGQSDKPKMNYIVKFYRDFLASFIEQLQLRATLVGSSLGGQIAAELAIARPDLVQRLVLISPAGALPASFRGSPALKRYVKVTKARSVEQVKQALFAVDGRPVDDAYARMVFERLSMPGAGDAFLSALVGSARASRLNSRLHKIRATTLLLWGKEDAMIPIKFVDPFVKMKNCRIIMLEGCGHRPHVEKPTLFNRLVTDFIKHD
jgi:pimeloyl-ACP methyl ester carboxylesterase